MAFLHQKVAFIVQTANQNTLFVVIQHYMKQFLFHHFLPINALSHPLT